MLPVVGERVRRAHGGWHHHVVAAPDRVEPGELGPPGGLGDAECGDVWSVVVELRSELHGWNLLVTWSWISGRPASRARRGSGRRRSGPGASSTSGGSSVAHALGPGDRAARMEPAPARYGERARRVAGEDDLAAGRLQLGIGHGDRRQQGDGVGVQRLPVQVVGGAELDEAAEVHHADAVGDVADDGEVVGDEHQREVEAILEVDEQVDDLRLDRHVERRDRLVGEDDVRLDGQRPGQTDALALAAGELVRVAVGGVGGKSDEAEQLVHPGGDVVAVDRAAARPAGVHQRLGDQPAHAESRVEAGVRDPGRRAGRAAGSCTRSPPRRSVTSLPSRRMRPSNGTRRTRAWANVLLPQPDSPTRPTVSRRCDGERHPVDGGHLRRRGARRAP